MLQLKTLVHIREYPILNGVVQSTAVADGITRAEGASLMTFNDKSLSLVSDEDSLREVIKRDLVSSGVILGSEPLQVVPPMIERPVRVILSINSGKCALPLSESLMLIYLVYCCRILHTLRLSGIIPKQKEESDQIIFDSWMDGDSPLYSIRDLRTARASDTWLYDALFPLSFIFYVLFHGLCFACSVARSLIMRVPVLSSLMSIHTSRIVEEPFLSLVEKEATPLLEPLIASWTIVGISLFMAASVVYSCLVLASGSMLLPHAMCILYCAFKMRDTMRFFIVDKGVAGLDPVESSLTIKKRILSFPAVWIMTAVVTIFFPFVHLTRIMKKK